MTKARDNATQGGLVLLNRTSFSSATTVTIDNVFGSIYDNYRLVFEGFGSSTFNRAVAQYIDINGNIVSSSYYSGVTGSDYASGATTFYGDIQTTLINLGWITSDSSARISFGCDIFGPNLAQRTNLTGLFTGINNGAWYVGGWINSAQLTNTQMRGIRITNSSGTNMTGTVSTYGYRK